MAPPPASPCTRTHTRAPLAGRWRVADGARDHPLLRRALRAALGRRAGGVTSMHTYAHVCTRMHTYAHVCITHELWSVSYAVYRDAGHTAQVNTNHQFQANTTTVGRTHSLWPTQAELNLPNELLMILTPPSRFNSSGLPSKPDTSGMAAASAAQAADWPSLAEARGSLRHTLAVQEVSGEPAGRSFLSLAMMCLTCLLTQAFLSTWATSASPTGTWPAYASSS